MAKTTFQHVTILGFVGKPPELRSTQGGHSVASFSVATDEGYKGKDGAWVDATEWHNINAWGELAELAAKELGKGDLVMITGRLRTRDYDKDGVKHYRTEIEARNIRRCYYEKRSAGQQAPPPTDAQAPYYSKPAQEEYDLGDLGPPLDMDSGPLSPGD